MMAEGAAGAKGSRGKELLEDDAGRWPSIKQRKLHGYLKGYLKEFEGQDDKVTLMDRQKRKPRTSLFFFFLTFFLSR